MLCERNECYSLSFVRMHILTTTQEEVFSVHFYEGLIETVIDECQKWYIVGHLVDERAQDHFSCSKEELKLDDIPLLSPNSCYAFSEHVDSSSTIVSF